MKKPVEALTDVEIARLLMRQLWQRYDVGGISMRRSRESTLLEAAMSRIHVPIGIDLDDYSDKELIEEADRRNALESQQFQLSLV
jgi:hypothetical protein